MQERQTDQQQARKGGPADRAAARRTDGAAGVGPVPGPALLPGGGFSPSAVTALQRTAGNAAVAGLLAREAHEHGPACGHSAPVQRSAVHDVLRSTGSPLETGVRTEMEARLGADFSDVRLHTDTVAQRSAAEIGAHAYTSGSHVVIGPGGADKHTLAHELTHVVQQRQGPVAGTDHGNGLHMSDPGDSFEQAAEANAKRVMSGPVPLENRPASAGAAEAAPVQRAALPIQRARMVSGKIAFTNVANTYPAYFGKAQRVLQLLSEHKQIQDYLRGRPCDIVLEKRIKDAPAEVKDNGDEGVKVILAAYYFENYDIGYIVGMLSHEFGIHPLAEAKPQLLDEEQHLKGMPFPVPGLEEQPKFMNSDEAKQADHVLGAIPQGPRYGVYKAVTKEMAERLLQDAKGKVDGAKEQDVTDLLDCFLMDVASIAATNDNRLLGAPAKSGSEAVRNDIAQVYNRYRALLSADFPEESPIKPLFPPEKTPEAVKQDFLTLAARIAKGAAWAWSISN